MKHGDKAKGKAGKASGKKSGKSAASKSSKGAQVVKGKKPEAAVKAGSQSSKPVARQEAAGNGKARARTGGDEVGFSNPVVAAAFKRAVKKYPNAFRRLTD